MFLKVIDEFRKINRLRWVPAVSSASNGVGLTFEKLIGKSVDTLFFPDFEGIELKCTTRYSRFPMSLFSVTFDGSSLFQMNKIVEEFGKEDKVFAERKTLGCRLFVNKYILVNNKFYFLLKIEDARLNLYIYDLNFKLLNQEAYVDLKILEDRLVIKLSKLAIVKASKKRINGCYHYRYYEIFCYQLTSFETFVKLLYEGKISVNLESYVSKSGYNKGKSSHKGLIFRIEKDNIPLLFDLKYHLNLD